MTNQQLLITQFLKNHPKEAIEEVSELKSAELADLIRALGEKDQQIILSGLGSRKAAKIIEKLSPGEASYQLSLLSFSVAEAILRTMEPTLRDQLIEQLAPELTRLFKRTLTYENNQVGAHLNPMVPTLTDEMTITHALGALRNDSDLAYNRLFVVSNKRLLLGYIDVSDLIQSPSDKQVKNIMKPINTRVLAEMSVKEILENWDEAVFEVPVTNVKQEFLGVVTRQLLVGEVSKSSGLDQSAVKAGNALADLYLIGLSSLLGNSGSGNC